MLILACDTSGPSVSAALWQNDNLVSEITLQTKQPHSVTLFPVLEELLRRAGKAIDDVEAFACAVGPGSFTGIRIGVSAIKGLAYATGKPAIGVSTLQTMAWPLASCTGQIICPILDARNHRIFASAWLGDRQLIDEANWLDSDFAVALQKMLAEWPDECLPDVVLVGHQPDVFFASCGKSLMTNLKTAPSCSALPRSAVIAELAALRLLEGEEGLPQALKPQYLSLSQAERRKAAGHD